MSADTCNASACCLQEKKTVTKRKNDEDSCCIKTFKTQHEVEVKEEEHKKETETETTQEPHKKEQEVTVTVVNNKEDALKSLDEWDDWKKEYIQKEQTGGVIVTDKPKEKFRNYMNSARHERVSRFYTLQHTHQTLEFAQSMVDKYGSLNHFEMTVWEALEYLDKIVDDSDPDIELTQLPHALQTAEACRKKWPEEKYDWLHLTGLVHDLGKILAVTDPSLKLTGEPQWAVVGDTFPVGAPFSETNVMFDSFKENPDFKNPLYNTGCGIYEKGCGLSKVTMAWGHDEYIYRVCVGNNSLLPLPALYILRYHSFYPWHREGGYTELTDEQDRDMLQYIKEFNECDLYSKSENQPSIEELAPYYKKLIEKYLPGKLRW